MARTNNDGAAKVVLIETIDDVTHYVNPSATWVIELYKTAAEPKGI